jgi:hypothetical protein
MADARLRWTAWFRSPAWHRSPHDVDPLSWFSGPLVPMVFGGLAMVAGVTVTIFPQRADSIAWFDWAALGFLFLGFLAIGLVANPLGAAAPFTLLLPSLLLGMVGVALSAAGRINGPNLIVEIWWAPIGYAFLVGALAPYTSALRLVIVGSLASVVTCLVLVIVPYARPGYWSPVSEVLVGASPVFVATAAASVFAYQIVKRVQLWAAAKPGSTLSSGVLAQSAKLRILRDELASVADRVVPLLQSVADSGVVTAADRKRAGELAEEVRAELVERTNRSWLDTLAGKMHLTILDTEYLADRMTPNQRAALLGLLHAVTDGAAKDRTSLVIQLRGESDGSTAVALSTDVHFPEGRRITLLAPHYFSLKATVDELEWDAGEHFTMRFRIPPEAGRDK